MLHCYEIIQLTKKSEFISKKFYEIDPKGLYNRALRTSNSRKMYISCSKLVSFLLPVTFTFLDNYNSLNYQH
jgi:hypothetical protein